MNRRSLLLVPALFWVAAATALSPATDFDLKRYTGTWYEFASIPGFLQSKCARDTQSEYSPAENGALAVITRCMRGDGTAETRESRTRPLEASVPAVLRVTAVKFLGIWWYPLGRESIVIAFDPDYRWIALGHPSLRYARILSRTPTLADDAAKSAAAALAAHHFDLCALVTTAQSAGRAAPSRLCDIVK
ncbi:MAG: lipocalin family protein [Casimicrobiaceae bacterium]